jgi:poly-gamma-glutamate synthesis protein (capsule biosynthesis protein)
MLARSVADFVTEDDPGAPFEHVRPLLEGADIAVVNLECAVSDVGAPEPKAYTFRAPPLAAKGLAAAGIDAVALANNHAGDYGMAALLDTLTRLDAAGVASAGAGPDDTRAYGHVVVERAGVRFAFLSFAEIPLEGSGYDIEDWRAGSGTPGIAWLDDDRALAAIAAADAEADIVVAMFHYGQEGHSSRSARQVAISHAAIDAGADLVLGTHSHVLQEVEEYGGGLIAYSLGNFVFDGFEGYPGGTESAILQVSFGPEGVESWDLVPAVIGWDGLPRLE